MTKDKKQNKKSKNSHNVEKISEKTKEGFLVEIQKLLHDLESLQEKTKVSESKKEALIKQINTSFSGKENFLKKYNQQAEEKTQELKDLQERMRCLEERREFEKERRREVLSEAREGLRRLKNERAVEKKHLLARRRQIEDFKNTKSEMVQRVEELKIQLEKNQEKHAAQVKFMEETRKNEIKKLKNEALKNLEKTGMELKEACMEKLPGTVKRASSQKESMQNRLDKLGEFSQERENIKLREEVASNSIACRKLTKNEKKLLEEFVATRKVIRLLEAKAKEHEEKKKEVFDDERVVEELEEEIREIQKLLEGSKLEKFKMEKSRSKNESSLSSYRKQIEKYEKDIAAMETAIQQAVHPMRSTIFANRSARKEHYIKANLDKYRDVLIDVHKILTNVK